MPTRSFVPRKARVALVVVGLALFCGATAGAQQDPDPLQQRKAGALQQRKAKLEVERLGSEVDKLKAEASQQKLEYEVKKIKEEVEGTSKWAPTVVSLLVAAVGVFTAILAATSAVRVARRNALAAMRVARRNQVADLDQATHEKRLECYPKLVTTTSPLAIYFPDLASPISANTKSLDAHKCGVIGRAISKWYYQSGLLLSIEARDACFRLARALTLASCARDLYVPRFPDDAKEISAESVNDYRRLLGIVDPNDETVEKWEFGKPPTAPIGKTELERDDYKFKDYVFLQTLSSRLRTALSEDLRSRRRLAGSSSRSFSISE